MEAFLSRRRTLLEATILSWGERYLEFFFFLFFTTVQTEST